jgi:hypothetical protein
MKFKLTLAALFSFAFAQAQNFEWANVMTGTASAHPRRSVSDPDGRLIVVGNFNGTIDLNTGPESLEVTAGGNYDCYIQKFDIDGTFLWGKKIGGPSTDFVQDVLVDHLGNVYCTGSFSGNVQFQSGVSIQSNGDRDVFIEKFDPDGNFTWVKTFGGNSYDEAIGLAIDENDGLYISGAFYAAADFNTELDEETILTPLGSTDIFILKLNLAGDFQWVRQIGGAGVDNIFEIECDNQGNIITSGLHYDQVDFDPDPTITNYGNSTRSTFIHKLNSAGEFVWVKQMPVLENDNLDVYDIEIDHENNIITTGRIKGTVDLDPDPETELIFASLMVFDDAFIQKLDSNGELVWAKKIGGDQNDNANGVGTDLLNNVYITGTFMSESIDFDPDPDPDHVELSSLVSMEDMFVEKLSANGDFISVQLIAGEGSERGKTVSLDNSGNMYIAWTLWGESTLELDSGEVTLAHINSYGSAVLKKKICEPSSATVQKNECDSYQSPSGAYIWSNPGIYNDIIPNSGGCDSLVTIELDLRSSSYSEINAIQCEYYISPSGNYTWNESGTYSDIIANQVGCDSLISIALTILPAHSSELTITQCQPYISADGTETWTTSGTYMEMFQAVTGCDSLVQVNLTIVPPSYSEINVLQCDAYTSPSGSYTWAETGTYTDIITMESGCDSIITINLIIPVIESTIGENSNVLSATSPAEFYQWINCEDNQPITGANEYYFEPSTDGSYALQLSDQGCIETSNCIEFVYIGLEEPESVQFKLYPNPSNGKFYVLNSASQKINGIKITDIYGNLVAHHSKLNGSLLEIDMDVTSGIYFVQIDSATGIEIIKLIKS